MVSSNVVLSARIGVVALSAWARSRFEEHSKAVQIIAARRADAFHIAVKIAVNEARCDLRSVIFCKPRV